MQRFVIRACVLLLSLGANACDDEPPCDRDAIAMRLAEASDGDVVRLGACSVEGPLTVPAGVHLLGAGVDSTTLMTGPGEVGVVATAGAGTTTVSDLRIESDGCAALVVRGDSSGTVSLEHLTLRVRTGVGIAADEVGTLRLSELSVEGPITAETANVPVPVAPYSCAEADPATHGLVVVGAQDVEIADVSLRGFAAAGALFVDAGVEWQGGEVQGQVGAGISIWGGRATLSALALAGAFQGSGPTEAANAVFAGGAVVSTTGLSVSGSDDFGLLQDGADVMHTDLVVEDNDFAGVWAQNGGSLAISGPRVTIDRNAFAGVASFSGVDIDIEGASLGATREGIAPVGQTGVISAADGLHVVGGTATLVDLALTGNPRVGVVLDLNGGTTDDFTIEGVRVEGTGEALGAIAQNGTLVPGWDQSITRAGATLANDAAFTGALDIADAIGPACIPAPGALTSIDPLLGP